MKRTCFTLVIILLMSATCYAVGAGIGLRSIAMGGAGIALADDTSAAYFNPAGLMKAPDWGTQAYLGGAQSNMAQIFEALSKGDKFITDFFDKDLMANANFGGGAGFIVSKVGFSMITEGLFEFDKPANSLNMRYGGSLTETFPLTIGSTFSTAMLPEVAFGVNIKPVLRQSVITSVVSSGATGIGTMEAGLASGFGFDVGAQAQITPWLTGGVVIRNLASSMNSDVTKQDITVYPITGTVESGAETKLKASSSLPTELGIGLAGIVPSTGTIIAGDLEYYSRNDTSYTDLHLGVEQKLLFNALALRLGYFTYGALSDAFITYGVELDLGFSLGFAAANSTKAVENSMAIVGFGTVF